MHEALGIDYANFKSSIPDHDEALHDACMEAWAEFGRLQPGGPYGLDRTRGPAGKPRSKSARKAAA